MAVSHKFSFELSVQRVNIVRSSGGFLYTTEAAQAKHWLNQYSIIVLL